MYCYIVYADTDPQFVLRARTGCAVEMMYHQYLANNLGSDVLTVSEWS